MKTVFVDSNVFLRFFARDDEGQGAQADALFQQAAAGKIDLITGPPVLFEVAWTLRSYYRTPRERILEFLAGILALSGVRVVDGSIAEEAVALARQSGQEFADAYIAVSARRAGAEAVATFNRRDFEAMQAPILEF
ncbi:MAG: PIN domain-containing protein [Candidatus Sumerlaeota bacterium]|nr:PIN domain-containing protein [Candidatus Sumerlaeota bacterium]